MNVHQRGSGLVRLLLLHGFTGTGDSFAHLPLDARFTVLMPDLPGHGASPLATSWDACLDALGELVDAGTIVAGYSMGARLALGLALRRPLAGLLLESGSPGLADPVERAQRSLHDEALAQGLERDGLPAFLERWDAQPLLAGLRTLPPGLRKGLLARRRRQTSAGLASALRALGTGTQPPLWDLLPRLATPTLLIAGERDAKFFALARRMRERLPNASLRVLPQSGHAPHLETPAEYAALLTGLLPALPNGESQ